MFIYASENKKYKASLARTMKNFKFYYDLLSPPSRALLIFFNVTKVQYEGVKVALRKGEHLTEGFAKNVNRFKKLPAIVGDDGFKLSESCAIINYLRNEGLIPETSLIPKDAKTFARMDEYLQWTHNNIRISAHLWFRTQWVQPFFTGEYGDKKEVSIGCNKCIHLYTSKGLIDKEFS